MWFESPTDTRGESTRALFTARFPRCRASGRRKGWSLKLLVVNIKNGVRLLITEAVLGYLLTMWILWQRFLKVQIMKMGTAISQTQPRYNWKRRLGDCYLNDRRKKTYKWIMWVHSQTEHAGQCAENSLGLEMAEKKIVKIHMEIEPHKIPKSIERFCLSKTTTFGWKQSPQNYFRHTVLMNRHYLVIPGMVLQDWVKLHYWFTGWN